MRNIRTLSLALLTLANAGARDAAAARLKDLADVEGFRPNPLTGVGIVVGLDGTGDDASSFLARRPLATMLRNLGSNIEPGEIRARNVAVVMVTAKLPPYARPGVAIDVEVSSIGTAKSLSGGTLIATALKGLDRQVYAISQGQLTVGGFEVSSAASGSRAKKNHVTVGRIPGGATVEREIPIEAPKEQITLHLREPDFTTATRIAEVVDRTLGEKTAKVVDPGVVQVAITNDWTEKVMELVAKLEALEATPDAPARVIIDERTGTVVVGSGVTLGTASIAYGGLYVNVVERTGVSQPSAFATGQTTLAPETQISAVEEDRKMQVLDAATTVGDVAKALNALGVKPRDLLAIFQALKAAGALRAEIKVM